MKPMIASRAPTALTLAPISPDAEAVKPWPNPTSDQRLARPAYYPFVYEWEGVDELLDLDHINDTTMISRIAALERVVAADFHSEAHMARLQNLSHVTAFRQFLGVCLERSRELEGGGVTPLVLLLRLCSWLRVGGGENRVWYLAYARRLSLALEEALTRHGGRLRPAETLGAMEAWARWDGLGAAFRRGRPSFALSVQAALGRASLTAREAGRALAALAGVRAGLSGFSPPAALLEGLATAAADGVATLTDGELVAAAAATRALSWPYHRCCVPMLEVVHGEALDRAERARRAEAAAAWAPGRGVHGGRRDAALWVAARRTAATAAAAKASASAAAEAVRVAAAAFHRPTATALRVEAEARGFVVDVEKEDGMTVATHAELQPGPLPMSAATARAAAAAALSEARASMPGSELEDLFASVGASFDEDDGQRHHYHYHTTQHTD